MTAHTPVLLEEVLAGLALQAGGRYCDATFDKCARYKSMMAGETPLVHLLPSGRLLRLD